MTSAQNPGARHGTANRIGRKVEYLPADTRVKAKLHSGAGVTMGEITRAAEEATEKMADQAPARFEMWIQDLAELAATDMETLDRQPALRMRVKQIALDLRATGATVGWPVVSMLATSMCIILAEHAEAVARPEKLAALLKIHVKALRLAVRHPREGVDLFAPVFAELSRAMAHVVGEDRARAISERVQRDHAERSAERVDEIDTSLGGGGDLTAAPADSLTDHQD